MEKQGRGKRKERKKVRKGKRTIDNDFHPKAVTEKCKKKEKHEKFVSFDTNAGVHPVAMMIKLCYTVIAASTVLCSQWLRNLFFSTIKSQNEPKNKIKKENSKKRQPNK